MVTLVEKYVMLWVSKSVVPVGAIRKEMDLQNAALVMSKTFYDLPYYNVNWHCINGNPFFRNFHLL